MVSEIKDNNSYSLWDYVKGGASLLGAAALTATVTYVARQALITSSTELDVSSNGSPMPFQRKLMGFEDKERRQFTYNQYAPYISSAGKPFPTSFPIVSGGVATQVLDFENCADSTVYLQPQVCDQSTTFMNLNFTITGPNNTALPPGLTVMQSNYLTTYRMLLLNATTQMPTYGLTPFEFRATNKGGNSTVIPFETNVMSFQDSLPQTGSSFPKLEYDLLIGSTYNLFIGETSDYLFSPVNQPLTISCQLVSADLSPSLSFDNNLNGYVLQGTMGNNPVYLEVTATTQVYPVLSKTFTISILPKTETNSVTPKPHGKGGSAPVKSSTGTAVVGGAVGGGVALLGVGGLALYFAKKKKNGDTELSKV